jgi:hypothetical protein
MRKRKQLYLDITILRGRRLKDDGDGGGTDGDVLEGDAGDGGAGDAGDGGGAAAGDAGGDSAGGQDSAAAGDQGAGTPDWRAEWATTETGEVDPEALKSLGRYHSKAAFTKAWKAQNDAIARGEWIKPLAEDASDEERIAFAKQLGVPEDWKGYEAALPEGLVIGDVDRPFAEKFFEEMHKAGARPVEVNAALNAYYDLVKEQNEQVAQIEADAQTEGYSKLVDEWGGEAEYKRNMRAAETYLDTLPKDIQNIIRHGTFPVEVVGEDGNPVLDGEGKPMMRYQPIGYHAETWKWLTSQALEANPHVTIVPGAGQTQGQAIQDEIDAIEKIMNTDEYRKDAKKRERYRELIDLRDKNKD